MYLLVDTSAPIDPPGKAPPVPVGDRNTPIDLLQTNSTRDDIGQVAAGYGEKQAPHEVNSR
jgi:hypothetical protein